MRRIALLVVVAVTAALTALPVGATPASTLVYEDPGVGGFMSPNISYVGTLPTDAPGVGAQLVKVDGQKRLYVSSVQGLRIWDVSRPATPTLLGALELPHWENEDITVSRDGKTVLMSEFTGTYMHVIEVRDLAGGLLQPVPVGFTPGPSGHIVDCMDDACDYVYGSEGSIIDLRDKANPKVLNRNWAEMNGLPTNGHNVNFDSSGLLWTDTTPIAALDVSDPRRPVLVVKGDKRVQEANETAYQHNNIRPNAAQYRPRTTKADRRNGRMRLGELLMGNGETNFTGTCDSGSGPFATYRIKTMKRGSTDVLSKADIFRPVSGTYADGNPAVNALGCSGHWFSVQPASTRVAEHSRRPVTSSYLVAAAWYEHGTRLLSVNKATGKVTQKGFFQPVVGSASAAHWINNRYIYTVDYERGIDILRYSPTAPEPTRAETDASWLAKLNVVSPLAEQERYVCRLVTQD